VQAPTKTLRDYQEKLIFNVCRATGDVLVEQPTGSGKTVEIVTLVAVHLGKRFTHAVISAPQEQIEAGFVKRDYNVVDFPSRAGVAVPAIQVAKNLIMGSRDSRVGSVRRIIQYIRQKGPLDHAFACTHAALNRLTADDLPANLTGKALFIDEAHHASADGLSQIVNLWRERGGQLFFFTATPYRGDGRPVKLDGMRTYRRSLAEHMAEGFAPRHLESEIVALGQPGDPITAGQFTGEEAPPASYFQALTAAICRRWVEDARPKAIVRVPPMRGGKSGELVCGLIEALQTRGARVLDATGTGVADKQRFLNSLDAEKGRSHADSAFDVMIGIQRVLEGTDWPVCSAVYCVGMPGSLNTVVQFLGRAMRLKGPDYPADQRDRARLVFFVPCGGGAALADLSIDHSRHALLTCCFLADHEVGQEWIVTEEVRHGIEAALGPRADNAVAAVAESEADEPVDPQVRAEVELAIASAREQIISAGNEPTLGEVLTLTTRSRPDVPAAAVERIAAEILAAQPTATGTAVRAAIRREVASRLRIDPNVKAAMTAAFAVVLTEFRAATLKGSAVLESVGRQVHGVTGGQMCEFAQRLRDAVPRPLTEEQILAWADAHQGRHEDWPHQTSGSLHEDPSESWVRIDAALRNGLRGLAGGSSLAQLLSENRGVRNTKRPLPLTADQVLGWADSHRERTGHWPTADSGIVFEERGETWSGINAALQTGCRGFPTGSSLARFLAEHRGRRNRKDRPVTTQQILAWADAHHERYGLWPSVGSGEVEDAAGETWPALNAALTLGGRGLSGRSSLAKLLAEHRGVANRADKPALTVDQVLAWADAHHEETGKWPTAESGPVTGVEGETWKGISMGLVKGLRGLPTGSSLARLLAERRNLRNLQGLADLTVKEILRWADEHFRRTGRWPSINSGVIDGTSGETWSPVQSALARGARGLAPSSLAQVLAAHRGRRNQKAQASLTVESILLWVDTHFESTGRWPTATSGPILGADGESWRNVCNALRIGLRGLPGGWSLARLIDEHRRARWQ
jgi:hypothetical protein